MEVIAETMNWVTWILLSRESLQGGKSGKDIPEDLRMDLGGYFRAKHSVLSAVDYTTTNRLTRGGSGNLLFFNKDLEIRL